MESLFSVIGDVAINLIAAWLGASFALWRAQRQWVRTSVLRLDGTIVPVEVREDELHRSQSQRAAIQHHLGCWVRPADDDETSAGARWVELPRR